MNRTTRVLVHGAIAGILAATSLALWFLVADWIAAAPLRTPAFLAGALLGLGNAHPTPGIIIPYTLFHYAVFILLGIMVAWLVGSLPMLRGVLTGVIVGFLLFDFLFYVGLAASGTNVIRALGWPLVLAGDVVAGIVMLGYLALVAPVSGTSWLPALREHATVRNGLLTGLIGATVLAVWFLIVDAIAGNVLYTPAALGSAFFFGATTPAQITIDFTTVAGYTLIHYAAFLVLGVVAAAVVRGSEDSPPLLLGLVMLFIVAETLFVGFVTIAANWILGALAWWAVALGNILASIGMGLYLWRTHPRMRAHIRKGPSFERPA